jgi:hypothetical protein
MIRRQLWPSLACVLLVVLGYGPASAMAQKRVRFDFRGVRLGAEKAAFDNLYSCTAIEGLTTDQTCWEDGKVGGVDVEITYEFLNGKFTGLALTFDPDDYEQVLASYKAKFGPAYSILASTVKTHSGARYQNQTAIWRTDSGRLSVSRYGPRVDKGVASIFSPAGLLEKARRKREAAKKAREEL